MWTEIRQLSSLILISMCHSKPNFSLITTIEYVLPHLIPDLQVLSKIGLYFHLMILESARLRLLEQIKKINHTRERKFLHQIKRKLRRPMLINLYKFSQNSTIKVSKLVGLNTKRIQFKECLLNQLIQARTEHQMLRRRELIAC